MQISEDDLASMLNTLHYHLRYASDYACVARVLRNEPGRFEAYAGLLSAEMNKMSIVFEQLRPHLPPPSWLYGEPKPAFVQTITTPDNKEAA